MTPAEIERFITAAGRAARRTMNRIALEASNGSLAFAKDQLRRHWPLWVNGHKHGGTHRIYRNGRWTDIPYGPGAD